MKIEIFLALLEPSTILSEFTSYERPHGLGITEGEPVFFAGHRKIDDEEYEVQRERARLGLVPDTEDVGSLIDDLRAKNARN